MLFLRNFNVIVVGAGHAGIEAAIASSKVCSSTLLLTQNISSIGEMSCNPSIGGIGKGHLVKENDAMGGIMAEAIDYSGIHFKTLNLSKGYAVRSTRAQADRKLYKKFIFQFLLKQKKIFLCELEVIDLLIRNNKVFGVVTSNNLTFYAKSVVLTCGTFLNGKIFYGNKVLFGGRINTKSSIYLSNKLKDFSFNIKRLKTGTPPRLDASTINFKILEKQYGDKPIPTFSFINTNFNHIKQVPCYLTRTNQYTHEIVLKNLNDSPLYSGIIKSKGPRYCPSLEDKVVKFLDKKSHQVFLEPEGLDSLEIYPNGISMSFPIDIQKKIVNSIIGLENAKILQPGYAVEYDFFDPRDLFFTLESKLISNLFFAGQINGTTGYEEAGVQGLLAGLNAARKSIDKSCWFPSRKDCYLGVLISDLCTYGVEEPYRIFTARSEYRLSLREDNADMRLTEIAYNLGLVSNFRWKKFCLKKKAVEKEKCRLHNIYINPSIHDVSKINLLLKKPLVNSISAEDLLKKSEISYRDFYSLDVLFPLVKNIEIFKQVEIQIKYSGYILKQEKENIKFFRYKNLIFPKDIDFSSISGFSNEVREKLMNINPKSLRDVFCISGITPAAISILLIWLKKNYL